MELKSAVAVCVISLFSATLVVLIARSMDSQAAARLEPQLARIVEELEAIRQSGGIRTTTTATTAGNEPVANGLVVYYFHGNTRCATCRAIESQSHATVQGDFAAQLASGQVVWKTVNYEHSTGSDLAAEFEIQMPVVVLATLKAGEIQDWKRLDEVWGLVGDKPLFADYVRQEINAMLDKANSLPETAGAAPDIPVPSADPVDLPVPAGVAEIPIPE